MTTHDVLIRHRHAEADFKMAMAKAVVAHRGEGDARLIESLALIDCETEFRAFEVVCGEVEVWRHERDDRVLAAQDAAADYHRSWAANEATRHYAE